MAADNTKKPKIGQGARSSFSFAVDSLYDLAKTRRENGSPPIDMLILHSAIPLFASTNQKELTAALQKRTFIVSCVPFMDETAANADLILPDHVFLEKWELSYSIPTVEFSCVGAQQPVIAPLYDSRHTGAAAYAGVSYFLVLHQSRGRSNAEILQIRRCVFPASSIVYSRRNAGGKIGDFY